MTVLHARFLEPEPFRTSLRGGLQPGRHFQRTYPNADYVAALARTTDGGLLDDEAAAALSDAVLQVGEPAGSLDLSGDEVWARRFVTVAGVVLDDVALASQLLRGGWLGRTARATLGSLPLRVVRRQVNARTLSAARAQVEVGWDSELINLLESAALRADRCPEEHLLLTAGQLARPVEELPEVLDRPRRRFDVFEVLQTALRTGATDVWVPSSGAVLLVGPEGVRATGAEVESVAELAASLGVKVGEVRGVSVEGIGRLRVSSSPGGLTLRVLGELRPPPTGLSSLTVGRPGLFVLGGPPASGVSSAFSYLVGTVVAQGGVVHSLEEPVSFPMSATQLDASSTSAEGFERVVRLASHGLVGIDLLDEARGVELALTLVREGRSVVVTMRGTSIPALVHRLAVLDVSHARRRVSEFLNAVVLCARAQCEVFEPTEALRRHLRAQDTVPPPIVFETP